MKQYAVGIDMGGTNIKAGLVQRDEGLVHHRAVATDAVKGADFILARIAALVVEMSALVPDEEIAGIGIGSPGAINWERDTVREPPNFYGWEIINVREDLQQRLASTFPVIVENDANVAGLGSAHYGAGRPYDSFIMVTLGTGVGGAIIYNNRIFRGATGGAGEIGHMTIDYEGPLDRAGVPGAIEAYLGQRFLARHARYRILNQDDSLIHEMAKGDLHGITPKMLFEAAEQGDEASKEMLAWAGHKLGVVLGSAINLLDIRKIIVGGGVSAAGDYILGPARKTINRFVMPGLQDNVEIILETLGNEAGILGAAHLIFDYLDTQDKTVDTV